MSRFRSVLAAIFGGLLGLALLLASAWASAADCKTQPAGAANELSAAVRQAAKATGFTTYRATWDGFATAGSYILQQDAHFELLFDVEDEVNARGERTIRNVEATISFGEGNLSKFQPGDVTIRGAKPDDPIEGWSSDSFAPNGKTEIWIEVAPVDIEGAEHTVLEEDTSSRQIFNIAIYCTRSAPERYARDPKWTACKLGLYTPGLHPYGGVDLSPKNYIGANGEDRAVKLERLSVK